MKILILEDEQITGEGLAFKIMSLRPEAKVLAIIPSVKEAVAWFTAGNEADLAFFDIHLADGLSFEIFNQIKINCPVIFTTAYDQYALRAFEVYSVDYLLKPVDKEAIQRALNKLEFLRENSKNSIPDEFVQSFLSSSQQQTYKQRFLVKVGERLLSFDVNEIMYFMADNKTVWMRLASGRRYPVDYKMDDLQQLLDPNHFFRINRSYLAAFKAIKEVYVYSNSRLKIELDKADNEEEVIVSRDRVEEFRNWMGK
ncbi:MAG: response regulator transcription factor [Saprospiraceae bacterium]|nr:response regulator transcription factor [Saprospiraceae bacterium]